MVHKFDSQIVHYYYFIGIFHSLFVLMVSLQVGSVLIWSHPEVSFLITVTLLLVELHVVVDCMDMPDGLTDRFVPVIGWSAEPRIFCAEMNRILQTTRQHPFNNTQGIALFIYIATSKKLKFCYENLMTRIKDILCFPFDKLCESTTFVISWKGARLGIPMDVVWLLEFPFTCFLDNCPHLTLPRRWAT